MLEITLLSLLLFGFVAKDQMSGQYSPESGKFKHIHCTCNWFQALFSREPGYDARERKLVLVCPLLEGGGWNLSNGSLSGFPSCTVDILHGVLLWCLVQI